MSCGAVHSQAREMLTQGYTAALVAGDADDQPVESLLPEEATR